MLPRSARFSLRLSAAASGAITAPAKAIAAAVAVSLERIVMDSLLRLAAISGEKIAWISAVRDKP
jgi:hypothetical protein